MKKLIITAFGGCVLLLSSCKENDLKLNYGSTSVDTTYVLSSVPAAQAHNVLIEEFTGQSCPNCPQGHVILTGIEGSNAPGRVNVIGLYMTDFAQTVPLAGSKYDFRDTSATMIGNAIYGSVGGIPVAGIDRGYNVSNATYQEYRSAWTSLTNTHLTIADSVNVDVTSTFNPDSTATIVATVTYLYPMSTSQSLNIAITEDGMVDLQEDVSSDDTAYLFTNVFRAFVTSAPGGDVLLPAIATKEAGRIIRKTYTYKPRFKPASATADKNYIVNPNNCKVIAYVAYSTSEGALKDVLQSASTKLVGP